MEGSQSPKIASDGERQGNRSSKQRAGKEKGLRLTENTVGAVTPVPHVKADDTMAQGPLLEVRVKPVPGSWVSQSSIILPNLLDMPCL